MNIIADKLGYVLASFTSESDAKTLYERIPESYKTEHTPRLYSADLVYPYCYVWTWDHANSRDEAGWKVTVLSMDNTDTFIRAQKKDKAVEKSEGWDDQYFYLANIARDGVCYSLRKALGMPIGYGSTESLSMLSDHWHMDWYIIEQTQRKGVCWLFARWDLREKYRKFKLLEKKYKRIDRLYTNGVMKLQKRAYNLGLQVLKKRVPLIKAGLL